MFGILSSLTKAAVGVVTLPVSAVADVLEIGDIQPKGTHTGRNIDNIIQNLEDAADPDK